MFGLPRKSAAHEDALAQVLLKFNHQSRRALYAASNGPALRRRTWDGCALNRAGETLGVQVWSADEAARAFDVPTAVARRFLQVWDSQSGSDKVCTARLRDTILAIGLYPESDPRRESTEEPAVAETVRPLRPVSSAASR